MGEVRTKNDTEEVSKTYNEGYHQARRRPEMLASFRWIARAIDSVVSPLFDGSYDHVDIGASDGSLVTGFRDLGVKSIGIDGSEHAVRKSEGTVNLFDLRNGGDAHRPWHKEGYDLVTSFDVAEHVAEEFSEAFCDNLVYGLRKLETSVLLFGPALKPQEGHEHINLQDSQYWQEKLWRRGLMCNPEMTKEVRDAIRENDAHSSAWWVEKNLVAYMWRPF